MRTFLLTAAIAYVWYAYAEPFSLFLYHHAARENALTLYRDGPAIFAGLLFACLIVVSMILKAIGHRHRGDGLWSSGPARRTIGFIAGALIWVSIAFALIDVVAWLLPNRGTPPALAIFCARFLRRPCKIFLGRATRPLRWLLAGRHFGMGGTSKFSGLMDEWANPWRPGRVLLGASLYDPKWLVGVEDDRHACLIATSRAGKGRSAIIPNLLTWPGSALVIDPKGQNAYVTALTRGNGGPGLTDTLGQRVRVVDPLAEIRDDKLRPYIARFNPLAELDLQGADYVERVGLIADALVVPSPNVKDSFFDNSARALISGLIDYVLISKTVGDDERNLATVRGLLIHPDGPPLEEMSEMGGLAQAGSAGVLQAGKNAAGDVISTAIAHTKWLDSVAMQRALGASDFSLRELNEGNTTVYLVLPPQYLDEHGRFLRLFVNLALQTAAEGRKGKYATLFLLDEFYALGRLQQLAKSAGLMAGYGVKLWPIIQNIGQVQELYPENWETFLGNAGQWMVFAVNDQTTAGYLSDRLGKRIIWRKMRGAQGFEWEIAGTANLRDAREFGQTISRASGKLTVFTESGEAFLLRRTPYDKLFKRSRYSPDPFEHSRPSLGAWAGGLLRRLTQWAASAIDAGPVRPQTIQGHALPPSPPVVRGSEGVAANESNTPASGDDE
jgi:Type IV secretory system Conjugative DNA transfer